MFFFFALCDIDAHFRGRWPSAFRRSVRVSRQSGKAACARILTETKPSLDFNSLWIGILLLQDLHGDPSLFLCHKCFSSVLRSKLAEHSFFAVCSLFSCWKHLKFKVIYVASAPDLDVFISEFANQLFKSKHTFKNTELTPARRDQRPVDQQKQDNWWLYSQGCCCCCSFSDQLWKQQLIPTCICLVILSSEVRQLD